MILHRSLALPRSVLNSTLSTTEASFSSVKIYGTISKRNFVRLSRGQRIVKPFISGPYVFRAYHWYQAQASRHSCIDESDPLLFPSLFHFRFPISLSFFLHGKSRARFETKRISKKKFLIETLCVQLIHSDTVCDYNCEISFLLVRGNQCF